MEADVIKKFVLACREATRILEMLPDLPEGIGPRDLRILDAVAELSEARQRVRVSDVSEHMGVSRPGVTRDIARLQSGGYLTKEPSSEDRRLVYVALTEEGAHVQQVYVTQYYEHLAEVLSGMSEEEIVRASGTIDAVCAMIASDHAEGGVR